MGSGNELLSCKYFRVRGEGGVINNLLWQFKIYNNELKANFTAES
jgi:hypothetical protein